MFVIVGWRHAVVNYGDLVKQTATPLELHLIGRFGNGQADGDGGKTISKEIIVRFVKAMGIARFGILFKK